jgi:predicted membrane protein
MLSFLINIINLVVVAFGAIGFFDALRQNPQAFEIYGRGSRVAWLAGLGISTLVVFSTSMYTLFGIVATVAIVVYQVDLKPNLREISGPRH